MPTISVNQDLIAKLLSIHGLEHGIKQISDQLPLLGTDIDRCDEDILDIEIFPNRPDLLSGETLSRAIRNFIHHQNFSVRPRNTALQSLCLESQKTVVTPYRI